jgi:competence protein ComEC
MARSLYCLNVGQANCLVVLDPLPAGGADDSQAVVIDVGVDGTQLARWLRDIGVRHIPLIVLTHNDEDHICGLDGLVQGFRRRIGQVRFVIDRGPQDILFWVPAQEWQRDGVIGGIEELRSRTGAAYPRGELLLSPPACNYWLFCLYPTVFEHQAAVQGAEIVGPRPRRGHNATSAVLGLATSAKPRKLRALFGADLDLPGWRCLDERHDLRADILVVPHHGGPRHPTSRFGFTELAEAVRPRYALVSVGTHQRFGHPLPEFVRALRAVSANVLCTQITGRCVDDPAVIAGRSVLPLPERTEPRYLAPPGTTCAGTVAVTIPTSKPPRVLRFEQHRAAVDGLLPAHHPLCRP